MTKKKALLSSLLLIGIGVGIGRYLLPNETNIEETKQERTEKEVERVVNEIVRPDGTKERRVEERTVTVKEKEVERVVEIKVDKPNYLVSVTAGKNFNLETTYGLRLDRRVFGNFFVGAYLSTNKDVGVSVGYEF